MNERLPDSETYVRRTWRSSEPGSAFTVWFSVMGFFAGGGVVFLMGVLATFPPQLPLGTPTNCGNCIVGVCGASILGGIRTMFVGAPIAAVTSAIMAAAIGTIVDGVSCSSDD